MKQPSTGAIAARKTAIALALASTPLIAQHAVAQQLVLEEVIVTAQKRSALVKDIAATVNVVSGEAVDKFSALSFDDIQAQTAGLTLATPSARTQNIAMRGVSIDPESGAEGTVDVYWNGQLVSLNIAFSQLYDLERIEVLRGPQGTLQGRAAPGGAINILTRSPDLYEASGYVQMTVGDNDGLNTQVAYGAPLIEGKLAARVAAVYDTSNARDVENITTGLDDPELKASSARIGFLWQATEDLSAELTYQYFDRDIDDPAAISGIDSLGERPSFQPDDLTALGKTNNKAEFDYDLVNLNVSWEFADHELTSVTGWSDETRGYGDEIDRAYYVTNPLAPTDQFSETKQEFLIQELRLASIDNDFWDYMVGVYFQDQDVVADVNTNTTTSIPNDIPVFGGFEFTAATDSVLPVSSKQWSIFSFNTFYLSDNTQLEFGLRYTDYERSAAADVTFAGYPYFPDTLAPAVEDLLRDRVEGALPISAISEENQDTSEDSLTGSLTFRWDWTDNVSLYTSYNRGYRPSGISIVPSPNVVFLPNGEDDLLYDEETSDAFEVGFKSRPMDGRATLNGALYYQQYDGYLGFVRGLQVENDAGVPQDLPGGIIFNGDANIWGAELEGQILLTETWNFGGSVSYVSAEWDGAEKPCNDREPGESLGSCDVDGENVGGEPEWSASLNSEYFYPLDNTELYIRGLYKYNGERENQDASAGLGDVTEQFDSFSVLDVFAGWRSNELTWDLSVWSKNLLNEDAVTLQRGPDQYDLRFSGGSYTQTNIVPERIIGMTARYNF
ncbi:MAG: TonB-dependent receptor [Halioglobus sp.]